MLPPHHIPSAVARKAAQILAKSPAAVRYGKSMFHRQRQMAPAEPCAYAGDVMARDMMEEDAGEGIDALLEKRAPKWPLSAHTVGPCFFAGA